jgi:putative restriction endonuclease
VISHGLPLTKIHHVAFDAHLISVDPITEFTSDSLHGINDGSFLELGLKGIAGTLSDGANRIEDRPDSDRLAIRFEQFKKPA